MKDSKISNMSYTGDQLTILQHWRESTDFCKVFLSFAGNGNSYINELSRCWEQYSVVRHLVEIGDRIGRSYILAPPFSSSGFYNYDWAPVKWLFDTDSIPPQDYLYASFISQPMIFLTQMARILAWTHEHGYPLPQINDWCSGITGHSQGIVSAVVTAAGLEESDFLEMCEKAFQFLFWQGFRMECEGRRHLCRSSYRKKAIEGLGRPPSPMASIMGLSKDELTPVIEEVNNCLPENKKVFLSLENGLFQKVISGGPEGLELLRESLQIKSEERINSVPIRGKISWLYLDTSAPFHSPYMEEVSILLKKDVENIGFHIRGSDMKVPVYSSYNGENLGQIHDLTSELIRLQSVTPVVWDNALDQVRRAGAGTRLVDLGPGTAVMKMSKRSLAGYGICVDTPEIKTPSLSPWQSYSPALSYNGNGVHIVNRFTSYTGRSPFILPGMTPTTATARIVCNAANAGFLAELAGGGQVTEDILRKRMDEIVSLLIPGEGVVLNTLYLDPYLWRLHISKDRLLFKLKAEGYPLLGLTISAGVPELDDARKLLDELEIAGMHFNSFKVGTPDQIQKVLAIAEASPQYTIMLQIESGLSGGHHGWYSLPDLLKEHYGAIRERDTLILVAGGGIRDEEDSYKWFSGEWSTTMGLAPMPVDALLIGTLAMACLESEASESCKQALVEAQGTDEWLKSGESKGGIISSKSQLDADIYYLDTEAARTAHFLYTLGGNSERIALCRDDIITRLSRTAKPYFGDIEDMSYGHVLERMLELMAIGKRGRYEDGVWPDITFRKRWWLMLRLTIERFKLDTSVSPALEDLEKPHAILELVRSLAPEMDRIPLSPQDQDFFIHTVCLLPGKPVNFVPVIDENIRRWYQSDMLWQCERAEYSPQEVLLLPGPRAVGGIKMANEPVADIFGRFRDYLISQIGPAQKTSLPNIEDILNDEDVSVFFALENGAKWEIEFEQGCSKERLTRLMGAFEACAITELVRAKEIITESGAFPNPIPDILSQGDGHVLNIEKKEGKLRGVSLANQEKDSLAYLVSIKAEDDFHVEVTIFHRSSVTSSGTTAFKMRFLYKSERCYNTIWQESTDSNVCDFYRGLFLEKSEYSECGRVIQGSVRLEPENIHAYKEATGDMSSDNGLPMAMGFSLLIKPLFRLLLTSELEGNILRLLHLSSHTRRENGLPITAGDDLDYRLETSDVNDHPRGKVIQIKGLVSRQGIPVLELINKFLIHSTNQKGSINHIQKDSRNENDIVILPTPYHLFTEDGRVPESAETFARASGDINPIHTDTRFAMLAGLPSPIMHGMWLKAHIIRALTEHVLDGDKARLTDVNVNFIAPAFLGKKIRAEARHTAMKKGLLGIDVRISQEMNERTEPVLDGRVWVRQPKTAYVFPGQGVQCPGMGMKGYDRSQTARAVWDEADRFTRDEYGFSILDIVRHNPRRIRAQGIIWEHEKGVLFLTQFTQVAMVVCAIASRAEMDEAGVWQDEALFCGHSIGEYSALAAVGHVISLESAVRAVYHRGLTMQQFVPRDKHGRSPYKMGVIKPHYAGLSEEQAFSIVADVERETGKRLEIVNYNIPGQQYSVTGEIEAIEELERRISRINRHGKPAYVDVPGIDVPFHSSILRSGVPAFRVTLESCLPEEFAYRKLIGRYIPNLTGKLFSLEKAFIEEAYRITGSEILGKILQTQVDKDENSLARQVVIELLAYQFASPVLWVDTQRVLYEDAMVERVIEIGLGHQPTLTNMAHATLKTTPLNLYRPQVLNFENNYNEIFYRVEQKQSPVGDLPSEKSEAKNIQAHEKTSDKSQKSDTSETACTKDPESSNNALLEDRHPSVSEGLKTILAVQIKSLPESIRGETSIDALLSGNSSRRNKLLIDIWEEFGTSPIEGAHEISIDTLILRLEKDSGTRYKNPGPYLRAAHDEFVSKHFAQVPFTMKDIFGYLNKTWRFGPGCSASFLNYLVSHFCEGQKERVDTLKKAVSSPQELKGFLDSVVKEYGETIGKSFSKINESANHESYAVDSGVIEQIMGKYFGRNGTFVELSRILEETMGYDPYQGLTKLDKENLERDRLLYLYQTEHSPSSSYESAIMPAFDPVKIRSFTSLCNWSKVEVIDLYHKIRQGQIDNERLEEIMNRLLANSSEDLANLCEFFNNRLMSEGFSTYAELFAKTARRMREDNRSIPPLPFEPRRPSLERSEGVGVRYVENKEYKTVHQWLEELENITHHPIIKVHPDKADVDINRTYHELLINMTQKGLSFKGKTALVTGAGPNSIATSLVMHLLRGGCRVIVTTSHPTAERFKEYKRLYQRWAGTGASLYVIPFNQGSNQDINGLTDWLFASKNESGNEDGRPWVIDYLVPFGAIGEENTIATLDSSSLSTLRVLLFGLEKLIGTVSVRQGKSGMTQVPMHVLIPLSPNHGIFGNDGLYGESKAALEVLFNKWSSEHKTWGQYTSLAGVNIGWVRSTGLMKLNDLVSPLLEEDLHLRTFSPEEMGFLMAALLAEPVLQESVKHPLSVDLTAGLGEIKDFGEAVHRLRRRTEIKKSPKMSKDNERLGFLPLERYSFPEINPTEKALYKVDLAKVVVIVGYGEIGPFGNAGARWEMESRGSLSPQTVRELSWVLGWIEYRTKGNETGWIDTQTGERVREDKIHDRYCERLQRVLGIRPIDSMLQGYDPESVTCWAEVPLERTLKFQVPRMEIAMRYASCDPKHVRFFYDQESDQYTVVMKKGTIIRVPRQERLTRCVAGQIPTGWNFERFGIPSQLAGHVDRCALFNLIGTSQAFMDAGMEPEEMYRYIHPAKVGNTQGSGIGGSQALARLHQDFVLDRVREQDTVQETLINVIGAHAIQSYIGSYGSMAPIVGACATAAVSIEVGVDKILTGKAELIVAGAYDDLSEHGGRGFMDMNATADTDKMKAMGFAPNEISRPNDALRRGFVEAQGGGTIILARADKAIEMGLPIYAVVAMAESASDGIAQSIPAPGKGLLRVSMEDREHPSPLRQGLAVFGLTPDDITVISKHDTSTQANDPNESEIYQRIMEHLGRSKGNPLLVISQKAITGHSKGGAAAWQIGGLIKVLHTGIIPGNPNLDDLDKTMQKHTYLVYPDRPIKPGPGRIKAALMSSLGFGHIGSMICLVHPDYIFASMNQNEKESYVTKRASREKRRYHMLHAIYTGKRTMYTKRTDKEIDENVVLLDPKGACLQ